MSSTSQNLRTDRQYKAATALSQLQFETLLVAFDRLYIPKTADLSGNQKPPVLTDKREALFFILHYYKAHPSLENMAPASASRKQQCSNTSGDSPRCSRLALRNTNP
jgi:hypothetical protein